MTPNLTFKTGTLLEEDRPDISYLYGRIDGYDLLNALNIESAYEVGGNIMCHCPNPDNHSNGDAHPSFGLNMEKMKYNCWVCGGGDLLDLVRWQNGANFEQAEKFLLSLATLELTTDDLVDKLKALMYSDAPPPPLPDYPFDNLFQYRQIHPWLYARGLTKEVIVEMQIGFDESHYAIIIPHFYMGKLVGWQIRHLLTNDRGDFLCPKCMTTGKRVPKYKNTNDFPKRTTLYNYDNALKYSEVHVIESPFSALYMMSHGFPNVVAHFGSPISQEQSNLLVRFGRVTYWPDNDEAGRNSTDHAVTNLWRYTDLMLAPVVNQDKGDPADLAPEELQEYAQMAYPAALHNFYGAITIDQLRQHNIETNER
jgi:hypothetical protein